MSDVRFRSDFVVKVVPDGTCGSDRLVALAAWAEDPDAVPESRDDTPAGHRRVIRGMVRNRHPSPFEKGRLEVYVEAPGVVWWQWTRHRFMSFDTEDFSFNLESGRYKVLDGVFYCPPPDRPCLEPEGFKPIRPELSAADTPDQAYFSNALGESVGFAWDNYERLVRRGFAREVARLSLPNWSLYCAGYVGAAPLTWLNFLAKRKRGGEVKTFPQWEIEQVAGLCEGLFAERWPIVYQEFAANGRVCL